MTIGFWGAESWDLILLIAKELKKREYNVLVIDHNEKGNILNSLPKPINLSECKDIISYEFFDFTEMKCDHEWKNDYDHIFIDFGFTETKQELDMCDQYVYCCNSDLIEIDKLYTAIKSRTKEQPDKKTLFCLRNATEKNSLNRGVSSRIITGVKPDRIIFIMSDEKDTVNRIRYQIFKDINYRHASQSMKKIVKELVEGCIDSIS